MSKASSAQHLASTYLRLKPDGKAEQLPVDDNFWPRLMNGGLGNFHNEYLVTTLSFEKNWDQWEVHPNGDEIVVLLHGSVDFIVETPEGEQTVQVRAPGDYAFVPQASWHTANVLAPSTMLFITAGEGTMGKPRTA